jgi:hypothetical protein
MRTLLFGLTLTAAMLLPAAPAAAQCCGTMGAQHDHAAPATAPSTCCMDHALPPMACCDDPGGEILTTNPMPVKMMEVVFRDPVLVGGKVLMGWYVIEHDDDRMARGEPCTYIYELDSMREPVVTFPCTHIERDAPATATVELKTTAAPPLKALKSFQFAGETAAHGVPDVR